MFVSVPGAISNAAFWLGLAAATPGMRLHVRNVALDPARLAFVDIMVRMGARIREEVEIHDAGKWFGHLDIRGAELKGAMIPATVTWRILDELPVLAVLAAVAKGPTTFSGVGNLPPVPLRRLRALSENMRLMNMGTEKLEDDFVVEGGASLRSAEVQTYGDYRMAMGLALAGLLAQGVTLLQGTECLESVYPGFFADGPTGSFTSSEPLLGCDRMQKR